MILIAERIIEISLWSKENDLFYSEIRDGMQRRNHRKEIEKQDKHKNKDIWDRIKVDREQRKGKNKVDK